MTTRYWTRSHPRSLWQECTRDQFITAERSAGFRPKSGNSGDLATGGFSKGSFAGTYGEDLDPNARAVA